MTVLYAALIVSTIVLVAVGLGLLVRLRRLSRATEAQFRRSVRDEDTAAKGGSSSYQ
jgi:hypothetical protein